MDSEQSEKCRLEKLLAIFATVVVTTCFPVVAAAQGPPRFDKQATRMTLDLRIGAMWPGREATFASESTRFSVGARFAPYLGRGSVTHRLSVQFGIDYIPVSKYEYYDDLLQSDVRYREEILVLNPALGFDVVQTPRVDLVVRYGGAAMANLTRLELPDIYGQFEDVCHLEAFEGDCPSRWNFVGNAGTSLRLFPKEGFPLYFGVDYTRYAAYKNQLVGTVGFAF